MNILVFSIIIMIEKTMMIISSVINEYHSNFNHYQKQQAYGNILHKTVVNGESDLGNLKPYVYCPVSTPSQYAFVVKQRVGIREHKIR